MSNLQPSGLPGQAHARQSQAQPVETVADQVVRKSENPPPTVVKSADNVKPVITSTQMSMCNRVTTIGGVRPIAPAPVFQLTGKPQVTTVSIGDSQPTSVNTAPFTTVIRASTGQLIGSYNSAPLHHQQMYLPRGAAGVTASKSAIAAAVLRLPTPAILPVQGLQGHGTPIATTKQLGTPLTTKTSAAMAQPTELLHRPAYSMSMPGAATVTTPSQIMPIDSRNVTQVKPIHITQSIMPPAMNLQTIYPTMYAGVPQSVSNAPPVAHAKASLATVQSSTHQVHMLTTMSAVGMQQKATVSASGSSRAQSIPARSLAGQATAVSQTHIERTHVSQPVQLQSVPTSTLRTQVTRPPYPLSLQKPLKASTPPPSRHAAALPRTAPRTKTPPPPVVQQPAYPKGHTSPKQIDHHFIYQTPLSHGRNTHPMNYLSLQTTHSAVPHPLSRDVREKIDYPPLRIGKPGATTYISGFQLAGSESGISGKPYSHQQHTAITSRGHSDMISAPHNIVYMPGSFTSPTAPLIEVTRGIMTAPVSSYVQNLSSATRIMSATPVSVATTSLGITSGTVMAFSGNVSGSLETSLAPVSGGTVSRTATGAPIPARSTAPISSMKSATAKIIAPALVTVAGASSSMETVCPTSRMVAISSTSRPHTAATFSSTISTAAALQSYAADSLSSSNQIVKSAASDFTLNKLNDTGIVRQAATANTPSVAPVDLKITSTGALPTNSPAHTTQANLSDGRQQELRSGVQVPTYYGRNEFRGTPYQQALTGVRTYGPITATQSSVVSSVEPMTTHSATVDMVAIRAAAPNGHPLQTPTTNTNATSPRPSILRKRTNDGTPVKKTPSMSSAWIDSSASNSPLQESKGFTTTTPSKTSLIVEQPSTVCEASHSSTESAESNGMQSMISDFSPLSSDIKQESQDNAENGLTTLGSVASEVPSVEASPRKKPRKQLLAANEEFVDPDLVDQEDLEVKQRELESRAVERLQEFQQEHVKKQQLHSQKRTDAEDEEQRIVAFPKRYPGMTLLSSFKPSWKSCHNHFQRYTDVKVKDDRRPTVNELANQKNVLNRINGWKLYHLTAQMDEMTDVEEGVLSKLTQLQEGLCQKSQPYYGDELGAVQEIVKGNVQRSKLAKEQLSEAKLMILKALDHKPRIQEIIQKHASKRSVKKKERI